jgi:repressor LexA
MSQGWRAFAGNAGTTLNLLASRRERGVFRRPLRHMICHSTSVWEDPMSLTPKSTLKDDHKRRKPTYTPKQLKILQLIRESRIVRGYSPTMQELADELGISKVTVFEHVEALIEKNALQRDSHKARSLLLADDAPLPDEEQPLSFPLIGKIAAGVPIEKYATDDRLNLGDMFTTRVGQKAGAFALRVDGESMRDEGILDGDYVIIERRETARNGDRVVALLPNGETTLKTFYKEGDKIRLQPANPDFKPIIVRNCKVQGVVIGVLRRY